MNFKCSNNKCRINEIEQSKSNICFCKCGCTMIVSPANKNKSCTLDDIVKLKLVTLEDIVKLAISKSVDLRIENCREPHVDDYYCDGKTFYLYIVSFDTYIYQSERMRFGWNNVQEEYRKIIEFLHFKLKG